MDNKLNYCELKMKTYDLEEVPDSVIKAVIGNLNKDDAMLSVLFNCYHQLNSDKNKDSFDYFTNLVDKIAKISGYTYSEDELKVYRAFAIPMDYRNTENEEILSNLIKIYEDVDSLVVSGDNLLYAQEYVRYNLLLIYSNNIARYYDKMKDLLSRLKENQSNYINLRDSIFNRLNKEEQ